MLEIPLAANWIWKLSNKLGELRGKRKGREATADKEHEGEMQAIADVLGTSPELLAEYYVQPRSQFSNPADEDEDQPLGTFRGDVREALNNFLTRRFVSPTGQQFLFILADAGMGKSSLLAMLKLTHLAGDFWRSDVHFELLKLGPSTLDDLKAIPSARNTVLLLDSLDEDSEAFGGDVKERLQELMSATKGFRQVIITCRTQFFPDDADIEKPGRIAVGDYEKCSLLYLSPFSDEQVAEYLKKRFSDTGTRRRAWKAVKKMHSLRMRPMLLAYIEDLIDEEKDDWTEFAIYEILLEKWLIREAQKGIGVDREKLKDACLLLARHLQTDERRHLSRDEFDHLSLEHSELAEIPKLALEGRALLNRTGKGEFRFAHFSIQEFLAVAGLAWGKFDYKDDLFRRTDMTISFALGATWPLIAANESLIPRIREQSGSSPLFLAGANLLGAYLPTADLPGAYLPRTNLREADLSGAELQGADLTQADLSYADLTDANLTDANLTGASLKDANLRGTILHGITSVGANFTGANLTQGHLSDAKLRDSELLRSRLVRANLRGADLANASLCDADLPGADLTDASLPGANLCNADLTGAVLRTANLSCANFGGANLTRGILTNADLSNTDLSGADLTGAKLPGADLAGADLTGAKLTGARVTDAQLHKAKSHHED